MLRKWLLTTAVSVSMVLAGSEAVGKQQDQGGPVDQSYGVNGGKIDPYYGDINPFSDVGPGYHEYGKTSPFWGDPSPYWGDINPFVDPATWDARVKRQVENAQKTLAAEEAKAAPAR